jgi:hypothetical protein
MKIFSLMSFVAGLLLLTGCTFTETLSLNEDGGGKLSVKMDASELMSLAGTEMGEDLSEKIDTVIVFKDILENQKDSISKLPLEDQQRLLALKPYNIHIYLDEPNKKFFYDVYLNFNEVSEADKIFEVYNHLSEAGGTVDNEDGGIKQESIKVNYSYKNKVFKRKAYIADIALHQRELDSLQGSEMILEATTYKLDYSFPRKIKSVSNQDALVGEDGKTLMYEVGYMDYFKNPEILDIEVILE